MCGLLLHDAKKCGDMGTFQPRDVFLCKSSHNGQKKSVKWHLGTWTIGFYMVSNSKNIDLNDKGCVYPTSLIIKSTCLIICFSFFYKVSIKNRFLYKMFFLLHLLQVQQHMMAIMMMRPVMKITKTMSWQMEATYLVEMWRTTRWTILLIHSLHVSVLLEK